MMIAELKGHVRQFEWLFWLRTEWKR